MKSIKQLLHRQSLIKKWEGPMCSLKAQQFVTDNREEINIVLNDTRDTNLNLIKSQLDKNGMKITTPVMEGFLSQQGSQQLVYQFSVDSGRQDQRMTNFIADLKRNMSSNLSSVSFNEVIPDVPWFPRTFKDMEHLGHTLMDVNDGLNEDHPQFKDLEYRKRRNEIAQIGLKHRVGEPIPRVEYTEQENQTWNYIYERVRPWHQKIFSQKYLTQFKYMEKQGVNSKEIPQLCDLDNILTEKTGFRIKPVAGILSQREFLNAFAHRVFCCTQYIRHHSTPEYTPEPDIIHEIIGHVPLFLDPELAELSQQIGLASLGASNEDIAKMGALYWYTIEFGAVKENGRIKPYSAGPAGSFKECENFVRQDMVYRKIDVNDKSFSIDYPIQDVQNFYFYSESIEEMIDLVKNFAQGCKKPMLTYYDHVKQRVETDRKVRTMVNDDEGPLF